MVQMASRPRLAPRRQRARRTRFNLVLFAVCSLIVVVIALLAVRAFASTGTDSVECQQVAVEKGDTLWTIAQRHAAPSQDIRALVHEIRKLNGLESAYIYPGQVLRVPTLKSD